MSTPVKTTKTVDISRVISIEDLSMRLKWKEFLIDLMPTTEILSEIEILETLVTLETLETFATLETLKTLVIPEILETLETLEIPAILVIPDIEMGPTIVIETEIGTETVIVIEIGTTAVEIGIVTVTGVRTETLKEIVLNEAHLEKGTENGLETHFQIRDLPLKPLEGIVLATRRQKIHPLT